MNRLKLLLLIFVSVLLASCETLNITNPEDPLDPVDPITDVSLGIEPHDTVYQLQVYAFNDSDGDGLGDFKGIADKVDYLVYLGIDAVWLSPIHPSPSYHHYDVTDYFAADPAYEVDGFTFDDLIEVLHAHGIDVILDIVVNHSSVEHPYFVEALAAFKQNTSSPYIDYYLLSDTYFTHPTLGYGAASLDGVYYDAFYGITTMPAFNYDHMPVREMFIDIFSFWLDKGVAGFRLDASKHVYDDTTLNNEVFTYFVDTLAEDYDDVYFVNEIWASQDEVIPYFESGMSNFNFDARNAIAAAIAGDRSYGAFLETYQSRIRQVNADAIEASFLSNHDIGRLGTGYGVSDQKMMAALNILVPGNSYVYYGDETMLTGERTMNSGYSGYIDAVYRTPMLWDDWTYSFADYIVDGSGGAIASARTTSMLTVEDALLDQDSLLNYYKALIELKNTLPILTTGTLASVTLDASLITYLIQDGEEIILVIHNLNDGPVTVSHDAFEEIIGSVSQTTDPMLSAQVLSIPASSSVIVSLSEPLESGTGETLTNAYVMSNINGWTANPTYMMDEDNGTYSFVITFTETSQFKVMIGDVWYGYDFVTNANGVSIDAEPTYNNIIIPAGTYEIIFKDDSITIDPK
jgi:glycosidase